MLLGFLVSTILTALWIHYGTRWVQFGPPSWFSTFLAVVLAQVAFTAIAVFLIVAMRFPLSSGLGSLLLFILAAVAVGIASYTLAIKTFLKARISKSRPTWRASLILSAATVAVTTLVSVTGTVLTVLISTLEAA